MPDQRSTLDELAALFGLQPEYHDALGARRRAPDDVILAMLIRLGAELGDGRHLEGALVARRHALDTLAIEPVHALFDPADGDAAPAIRASLPRDYVGRPYQLVLRATGRDAATSAVEGVVRGEMITRERVVDGAPRVEVTIPLPPLAHGRYHAQLSVAYDPPYETWVLRAATRCYVPDTQKAFGLFAPLYALRGQGDLGVGDLGVLRDFGRRLAERGGAVVATLPLLAAFLDEPFEPSPYAPASRLFFNELYLAIDDLPEIDGSEAARVIRASDDFIARGAALSAQRYVDYAAAMRLRRDVLEPLAATFFARPDAGEVVRRFVDERPRALDYARFRAAVETRRSSFHTWSGPAAEGVLRDGDYDESAFRYHLYVQLRLDDQLRVIAEDGREHGLGLYLDLPLGVHPDGYDAYAERTRFLSGAAAGAPPDPLFTLGQNWGFSPPHPGAIREDGYGYLAECLDAHMRHAGVLRLDHVMGFHRVFAVPTGADAKDGLYVRYRSDEHWALLSIASHANRTLLVGEDLGTVPDEVREAMSRHDVFRLYVSIFEMKDDPACPFKDAPPSSVAGMNTHDMPTFPAQYEGLEIERRQAMGQFTDADAQRERDDRAHFRALLGHFTGLPEGTRDAHAVLRRVLSHLAHGPARVVLASLEDLLGETEPQNVPGTWRELPNWRRRMRVTLDEALARPEVRDVLAELAQIRPMERAR